MTNILESEFEAHAGSTITLTDGEQKTTVNLYSDRGLELISTLWLKLSAEYKIMYEPTWLGRPIIQLPHDIVQMQELIWKTKPDFIVETGIAHGGSLVFSASMLELIGSGRVIGIDIDIRKHNRRAIEEHFLKHRIDLIEGSSTDKQTLEKVRIMTRRSKKTLVILDSNHSTDHVYKEMQLYSQLVTPGSYLVVMDGAQAQVADIPRGKPEWRFDNPLAAINRFTLETNDFEIDPQYTRMHVTSSPCGFLRRRP